jgi:hypothetical protein
VIPIVRVGALGGVILRNLQSLSLFLNFSAHSEFVLITGASTVGPDDLFPALVDFFQNQFGKTTQYNSENQFLSGTPKKERPH